MKAYKVFDKYLKCRGFQYEIGKTYEMQERPILCKRGFHACLKVSDCFNYYSFDIQNRICEVELEGIILGLEENKQCCNKITILKEITWNEMLTLANSGIGNSGINNSGNYNSGYYNSGDHNSGYYNSGDYNSGYYNSGYYNSGDRNSGNYNSGNRNSGNYNSGNYNSGYYNSGNYNSGNYNSGYFNSNIPDIIRVFNKNCKRINWENAKKPNFIYLNLTEWISFLDMSDQEKISFPKAYEYNGYLKQYSYKEAWKKAFKKATEKDIKLLKALPNFDAGVFEEITGIKIDS